MRRVVQPSNQVRSEFGSADNVIVITNTVITDIVITDIIDGIVTTDGMNTHHTGRSSRKAKIGRRETGGDYPPF